MESQNNLKYIDLFAGIGGFRLAMNDLGHDCVFSSEWDKDAQIVYKDNFGEQPEGDITKIPANSIPKHDVLCAGFPCQAFSISGKQKGFEDTRGTLFYDIARIAEYHQPKYLFLENVQNLEKHNYGKTLKTILNTLEKINYDVFYSVLNASFFGVPQARKRIYFIAVRKDFKCETFHFPSPTYEKITLHDIILTDKATSKLRIKRNDISLKKNRISFKDIKEHLKPIRIGHVNKAGQGERIYHEFGHAITLSAYGGGVGAKTGLYNINGYVRKLDPHECKRLMDFPKDFKLPNNPNIAYKQFGNSVVVSMISRIFSEVMNTIECKKESKMLKSETMLRECIAV